jgi:hypothetical protein
VARRLFSWDLSKQRFGWNWIDNAKVSKTRDGNGIKLSDGSNSAHITLSPNKTNATLFFKKEEWLKFVIQGSDVCTSQRYRTYLRTLDPSRLPSTISLEEYHMKFFHLSLDRRAQQLEFSYYQIM